jgi:regulator of RNase E activity RraA
LETAEFVLGFVNQLIFYGGVLANPKDFILGGDYGIVVVSGKECEAVLEKAIKRVKAAEKKAKQLNAGFSNVELNQTDRVFESLGLVE